MARCVWPWRAFALALFALSGCGLFERAERPAWRTRAENACFAEGRVKPSGIQQLRPAIDGPGICGLTRPLKVSAFADGQVSVNKPLTLDCPMTAALESWLAEALQPNALRRFGAPIVRIDAFGAYSCRSIDNLGGMPLSEHAFGNAVDIGGFTLADGRSIVVARDWDRPNTQEAAFLREADASACERFTTVLAPGADEHHSDHMHLDLAMHGRTSGGPRRICRPEPTPSMPLPSDGLPPAPNVEEPLDVSRAPRLKPADAPLALQGGLRAPLAEAYEPSLAPPPVLPMGPESRLDSADSLDVPGD
jgi:hypothetical protein